MMNVIGIAGSEFAVTELAQWYDSSSGAEVREQQSESTLVPRPDAANIPTISPDACLATPSGSPSECESPCLPKDPTQPQR